MRRFSSAVLICAAAARLCAQEEGALFRSDTRLVVLHATVLDKSGKLVTNLPEKAFQVIENGVAQKLKTFRREDVPVSMGIIVDNSGSMRDKRLKVEAAAIGLVKASHPQDEVFIVNFNDEAFLDRDFTNSIKDLEEGLTKIDSRGGTAMRDAVRMSIDHMKEKAKRDKKVLLVITDGNDNSSMISLENLVKAAQESEILLYGIGLLGEEDGRDRKRAKRALDALTEATGGAVYYPKDVSEVEKMALQVAHDIRNQYILAYSPINQNLDGSFRQIKVTAQGSNRPVVRTRTGYYATPDKKTTSGASSQ